MLQNTKIKQIGAPPGPLMGLGGGGGFCFIFIYMF